MGLVERKVQSIKSVVRRMNKEIAIASPKEPVNRLVISSTSQDLDY